jgi:hypothetical protein
MTPERKLITKNFIVEEFSWNQGLVVYINNIKSYFTFEQACIEVNKNSLPDIYRRNERK